MRVTPTIVSGFDLRSAGRRGCSSVGLVLVINSSHASRTLNEAHHMMRRTVPIVMGAVPDSNNLPAAAGELLLPLDGSPKCSEIGLPSCL